MKIVLKTLGVLCIATAVAILSACGASKEAPSTSIAVDKSDKIEVKVVVVTMFELGEDEGDTAGEFQLWKERAGLDKRFAFPQSHHDLFMNEQTGVLGMVTGMGTAKSSSAIMALGLDPRFDLTKAYWLVAGISGFDPNDASIGSAAWAEYLVDGDLGHEIDPREMPDDWEFGFFPLFTKGPFPKEKPINQGEMFQTNVKLRDWAFELTKELDMPDDAHIAQERAKYTQYPNAQKAPFVMKGDQLAAMTFWHGEVLNQWANRWVDYWSDGKGEFVSSAMEDTGTAQSLTYLDRAGKVDYDRFMVLRTASNFTVPGPGLTPAENLAAEGEDYAGLTLALESAYLVGGTVVNTIVNNWDRYATQLPYEAAEK
ncbi:purine nucleoside permease [Marinibactrum halimedae]|uniref:NUP-family purine nucleoside permease n=1 Tax=Marinibactrum halimedae TaxID=1444977 RepID=A0AA37TAJ7_9GAMM|nr:purine nucleoside permease [Marinibactrum halimedae]MCD9459681.1 purine nucleoside permease [Marinibactrum halimedae]GLS25707.1 NUP-family purine nucleoside permease [Marinibactrum halimedae]